LSSNKLLIINGAAILVCAVFCFSVINNDWRTYSLLSLLLFLPFLDSTWSIPKTPPYKFKYIFWLISLGISTSILIVNTSYINTAIAILFLTALPEEWFFRTYFMIQLKKTIQNAWQSNIITSVFFASLHMPTQGVLALSIIIPSLFFGWVYQQTNDIVLICLLHTLSNIIFLIYITQYIHEYI